MINKKNVIVFHVDQQRADSLGCMGNRFARTPNLDRLAREGTLFTRHISSNTICMPSRASLMTGLYPPGHNLWCNGVPLNRKEYAHIDERHQSGTQGIFHPEPITMADMFAGAGYDTAAFGKLHLTPYLGPVSYKHPENVQLWESGVFNDWHGPYYGFQHVELVIGHGEGACRHGHYALWLAKNHPEIYNKLVNEAPERPLPGVSDLFASRVPLESHYSTWLGNRLCEYVRERKSSGKPFFAFVGFPDPHHPFTPCYDVAKDFEDIEVHEPIDPAGAGTANIPVEMIQEQMAKSGISRADLIEIIRYTYAMVYQIDMAVGRALDMLDAEGLGGDTMIIFTGDHGDFLGDHGLLRKGFAASDSLLRVPFIMKDPASGLPARIDAPMSNCDVLPTLAAMCGLTPPEHVNGRNILESDPDHCAFAFNSNGSPDSVNYTVYDSTRRMTWYPAQDYIEMFNHETDPGETENIALNLENKPAIEELKNRISRKLAECHNPILGRVSAW